MTYGAFQFLYVLLDEGGNADFSSKGSKYFTMTSAVMMRPSIIDAALLSLKYDLIESGENIEWFHATEDQQRVRDDVFANIGHHLSDISLHSVIVDKRKAKTEFQDMVSLYSASIAHLLRETLAEYSLALYKQVLVMTDTLPLNKKRKAFEKTIKQTLSEMLPSGVRYRVMHHASKSCVGLQVADYCNWAIYRKWENLDLRSYDLISKAIKTERNIF
jgi:hypothetical protein